MSYDRRFQTTNTARSRRPLYAPPPAPGRSQHSVLGYWVPLITVSTIALGGLAAWIWSERSHDDDDDYHGKPPRPQQGQYPPSSQYSGPSGPPYQGPLPSQSTGPQGMPPPVGGEASSYYTADSASRQQTQEEGTWMGQVKGVMRRAPSPQQFLDNASKQVGGAMAAAGAALGSIMEEDRHEAARRERRDDREGFSDHERWSEEAEEKLRIGSGAVETATAKRAESALKQDGKSASRKTVALVVSADVGVHTEEDDSIFNAEHAVSLDPVLLKLLTLAVNPISPA